MVGAAFVFVVAELGTDFVVIVVVIGAFDLALAFDLVSSSSSEEEAITRCLRIGLGGALEIAGVAASDALRFCPATATEVALDDVLGARLDAAVCQPQMRKGSFMTGEVGIVVRHMYEEMR